MGLAAPRKKTKISHDPNNTNWARSTSGFGHRIMRSQGWAPGSLLGAKDAAHADMFTAASSSHIKVAIKDDTLGLGARAGRDPLGEPTGLDAFKGLLGRLNGKTEAELKQEQGKRDDVRLARYAAMKFPEVRFISGGLLTQEKLDRIPATSPEAEAQKQPPTSRKENASSTGEVDPASNVLTDPTRKSSKSSKKARSRVDETGSMASVSEPKKKKKSKKRKANVEVTDAPCESPGEKESKSSAKGSKERPSSAIARERRPMGRHVFRGRHIEQKKKALLDDKSLNEIFMVKA